MGTKFIRKPRALNQIGINLLIWSIFGFLTFVLNLHNSHVRNLPELVDSQSIYMILAAGAIAFGYLMFIHLAAEENQNKIESKNSLSSAKLVLDEISSVLCNSGSLLFICIFAEKNLETKCLYLGASILMLILSYQTKLEKTEETTPSSQVLDPKPIDQKTN
ncbi:hypothetical protein RGU75_02350 [Glaciimonas sp. CA11.2]|uniref:hypothetical protein n=1 Tax=Glaciimonas sp. CA11.2 TaxID=3048601 RepID=UPI002AB592CA|nr:hypothetical protein [Glaciimonas sp. CA11.2]MDY7545074.1 hypothetical protein [Glaciimonas sp. CA11.2]